MIIHQKVEWLPSSKQQVPNEIELGTWMVEGKVTLSSTVRSCKKHVLCTQRKATIADEKYFFDHNVLKSILENKVSPLSPTAGCVYLCHCELSMGQEDVLSLSYSDHV